MNTPLMKSSRLAAIAICSLFVALTAPRTSFAVVCVAPDDGAGSATLPNTIPTGSCTTGYVPPTEVYEIIDGLPPGTTIEIAAEQTDFACAASSVCSFAVTPGVDCNDPGGSLGGGEGCASTVMHMTMTGTGTLVGFSRMINLPVDVEHHFAPRTPATSPQSFDTVVFRMFGQVTGDPDFDLLRIVGGSDFGLPSPGHTILTSDAGGWAVDSFFDVTYRIDFVGAPGGALAGNSGSTTGTIRIRLGEVAPPTTTTTTTTTTTLPPVYDHLECFRAKDSVKLRGVVDLPTLAGTPYDAAGCTISRAKKYCTPAQKLVVSSTPPAIAMPGPDLTSDYVCYRIKCPKVDITQGVADQFGTRDLIKMKQTELCVPAVRMP